MAGRRGAILVIAFWLLFTRRVHTVFASTGLTNVYRQKLTGNLFGRIVDGNYYFIDGHARATDLLHPPLLFIGPCSVLRTQLDAIIEREPRRRVARAETDPRLCIYRVILHRSLHERASAV